MTQGPRESPRSTWIGLAIIATVVLVVAVWMSRQTSPVISGTAGVQPATPTPGDGGSAGTWFLPDDPLLGFVEVPAGPFLMGSDAAVDPLAFDNERWSPQQPQGTVDLPAFYIGRSEVTVAQFGAFVAATGFRANPGALQAPADHPVTNVSWPDALAYCRWLDASLQANPLVPQVLRDLLQAGWQVTLPTEAQWEKAARGPDGRIYPWGNEPRRDRANYESTATVPVGTYPCPECPLGLLDMSGNVWEWTRSPYQPYPYAPADDRRDLAADALWVMRGGHFADPARNIRAAIRGGADPGARRAFIGFRAALSPS